MKKTISAIKNKISPNSMRFKLFVSFSATIVVMLLLVMVLLTSLIGNKYKKRILFSASQSYEQAYAFLQNYIDSMIYASELVYYNGDIQRVFSSANFTPDRGIGEQYREFLNLEKVFTSVEKNENIYIARAFVPDEIKYSNNQMHFASMSRLSEREDYDAFLASCEYGQYYFTESEDFTVPGRPASENIVSLLRPIKATDGTTRLLAYEQIGVKSSDLQSVIEKANITSSGLVYLVNSKGTIIMASQNETGLLEEMQKAAVLPLYGEGSGWLEKKLGKENYFISSRVLKHADWSLIALVPENEIQAQGRQVKLIIIILTIISVLTVFVLSFFISRYYTRRLSTLADMMSNVRRGKVEVLPEPGENSNGDEIDNLFASFAYMTRRIDYLLKEQYKSGKAVKSAQFKALQAQINPHFLYNTLDLINWEAIDHNVPEIAEIAQSLARFYRISLNSGRQIVTVEDELRHVEAYVNIEKRHFDDAIGFTIDVPEEIKRLACINIILQPFVENSIMHNLARDNSVQECNIEISGRIEGSDLILSVRDDGLGMTKEKMAEIFIANRYNYSHGYGVKNINSRIKLCYGEDYGLTYSSGEESSGVRVEIRIPALRPEEAEKHINLNI